MKMLRTVKQWWTLRPPETAGAESPPILAPVRPERLIVPLTDPEGAVWEPVVAPGEAVTGGQVVARGTDPTPFAQPPRHAALNAVVEALETVPAPHPAAPGIPAVTLRVTQTPETIPSTSPPDPVGDAMPDTILRRIHEAGIVGLGGALFPTALKLSRARGCVDTVIVNAVECDPGLHNDAILLEHGIAAVLDGARAAARATGATTAVLAVQDPLKARQCRDAMRAHAHAVASADEIQVRTVAGGYPEGYEARVIEAVTGRLRAPHESSSECGVVCLNAATAAAIAGAVSQEAPLTRRWITVSDARSSVHGVVSVPLGTPLHTLLAHLAAPTHDARVRVGPWRMATSASLDAPVLADALGVWIDAGAPPDEAERPCIRCGACADTCPVGLLPQELLRAALSDDDALADALNLDHCLRCGACDAVCPSRIPLTAWFRHAQDRQAQRADEAEAADRARQRYEAHQARVTRRTREREEARRRRREAARSDPAAQKATVAAAVARARARKKGTPPS